MSEFCEHCDWWFRDPSPAECPGCRIAALEAERDRLRQERDDYARAIDKYNNVVALLRSYPLEGGGDSQDSEEWLWEGPDRIEEGDK
jgi:hypothetical protein